MATVRSVTVTCDLPHEEQAEAAATLFVRVGQASGEIDACEAHAAELRELIRPWLHASRARKRTAASRTRGADIRTWAAAQHEKGAGPYVDSRGRLPVKVIKAYDACH
jgi:hypothetical protein